MLAQTDEERERYESRRKAQLDYSTGLRAARLQGLDEGRKAGQLQGVIQLCQRLLRRPETPAQELAAMSLDDLTRLAEQLQALVQPH